MSDHPANALSPSPLSTEVVGSRVLLYEVCESTNDRALAVGGNGTVVAADRQTAGRGRHGRSWHSAPGLGLWFSVAFSQAVPGLAFAAPLSVQAALAPWCDASVKWPNDVLVRDRKICGVLVESRRGTFALGIGINVNHEAGDFPPDLRSTATSLAIETGERQDRGAVLRSVLTELDKRVILLQAGQLESIHREWSEACRIRGRRIQTDYGAGVVADVDIEGALVVDIGNTRRRVLLGEVIQSDEG